MPDTGGKKRLEPLAYDDSEVAEKKKKKKKKRRSTEQSTDRSDNTNL